jgi:hypothetical protein
MEFSIEKNRNMRRLAPEIYLDIFRPVITRHYDIVDDKQMILFSVAGGLEEQSYQTDSCSRMIPKLIWF